MIENCAKEFVELRNNFEARFPGMKNMQTYEAYLLE